MDLSPLCGFDEADAVFGDLSQAVTDRAKSIMVKLEKVQSWLNPYKGQPRLTKEKLERKLAAGELQDLREIIGVYGITEFYGYLKGWKANGKFLKLIALLGKAVTSLDDAMQAAKQSLQKLQGEFAALSEKREATASKVEGAAKAHEAAASEKEALDKAVQGLQERETKMLHKLSELEAMVEQARRSWEGAKTALVKAHQEAISLLESLEEEAPLAELELQSSLADEQVSALELALAEARESQRSAEQRPAALPPPRTTKD